MKDSLLIVFTLPTENLHPIGSYTAMIVLLILIYENLLSLVDMQHDEPMPDEDRGSWMSYITMYIILSNKGI